LHKVVSKWKIQAGAVVVGTYLPGRRRPAEVVEQVELTPFGFNPEEYPHPTASDLEEHEQE